LATLWGDFGGEWSKLQSIENRWKPKCPKTKICVEIWWNLFSEKFKLWILQSFFGDFLKQNLPYFERILSKVASTKRDFENNPQPTYDTHHPCQLSYFRSFSKKKTPWIECSSSIVEVKICKFFAKKKKNKGCATLWPCHF